jgi:hypothetical protein
VGKSPYAKPERSKSPITDHPTNLRNFMIVIVRKRKGEQEAERWERNVGGRHP